MVHDSDTLEFPPSVSCSGNLDANPSSSDSELTYERLKITSYDEPMQMFGSDSHMVSGFGSTPCEIFYQASLMNAPSGTVTTLAVSMTPVDTIRRNSAICVMTADKGGAGATTVASWRKILEADGFVKMDNLIDELYIAINTGTGAIYQLSMHCKYNAVSVTLPPVPQAPDRTLELGLCVFGYDLLTAAATIGENAFTSIPSSEVTDSQLMFAENPYWELKGFNNTRCNNGGIFLQAPTPATVAGEVISVTVNHLQELFKNPAGDSPLLAACQGDCDDDRLVVLLVALLRGSQCLTHSALRSANAKLVSSVLNEADPHPFRAVKGLA